MILRHSIILTVFTLVSNLCLAMNNGTTAKFENGVLVTIDLSGTVKIIDHEQETSFSIEGKPSHTATGNVKITELSGINSDKNKQRSWTLVQLPPDSSTAKHSHNVATEDHYAITELTIELAGKDHRLQAGQFITVPPQNCS